MIRTATEWNPLQASLKKALKQKDHFEEGKGLLVSMHAKLHQSRVYEGGIESYEDTFWKGLDRDLWRNKVSGTFGTIPWHLWHITRIEELTVSFLLKEEIKSLLDDKMTEQLNIKIRDTGNAMDDDEIESLSRDISLEGLKEYRYKTGCQTRDFIKTLEFEDLKRHFTSDQVERLKDDGGVTEHPDSVWLLDFWGKKDVAGIILMPLTRHQTGHFNSAFRIKSKLME